MKSLLPKLHHRDDTASRSARAAPVLYAATEALLTNDAMYHR